MLPYEMHKWLPEAQFLLLPKNNKKKRKPGQESRRHSPWSKTNLCLWDTSSMSYIKEIELMGEGSIKTCRKIASKAPEFFVTQYAIKN